MGGNRLISLLLLVLVAGVGAYFLIPGFRTKVDETVKGMRSWDAEARRKNPSGFITYAMKSLEENVDKFEQARADLRVASTKLERLKTENQAKVAFAEKELLSMKAAYKSASAGKGWPITVGSTPYKEAELKSQVNVLLTQRGGYEKILKQLDSSIGVADRKGLELLNRVNESQMQLSTLEAQKTLVEVNKLSADTEKLLAQVQDVLLANEALAEKPVVRTVEELMKEAGETTGASNPSVDAFLNG